MSTAPRTGSLWVRWALTLGLGFAIAAPAPAEAGRRPSTAARGRAKPVARKRASLPPPAAARVAIGEAARLDEVAAPRARAASAADRAATAIDKLLRGPLRHGTTALYVVDADTGRELFSLRPDERLNPASNVKLISTAAALELLGPDFRYRTRLLGAPADPAGVVDGDVYLHGSYDPTLAASHLEQLAADVAAAGVKEIRGDVVVGSIPTRDGLYRSRIALDVTAGAPGAAPQIVVHPAYELVELDNRARTSKRKSKGALKVSAATVTRDGRTRLLVTVTGTIGKGRTAHEAVWTKERNLHAAHLVRAALRRAGVTVTGDVAVRELDTYVDGLAAAGRLPVALAEHRSAPLADIVALVNKRSINWLSDRVIATAALAGDDELPSVAGGVDAMYAWLARRAGIARADAVIDTGSGLSHRTQLTARQLVSVLRIASGLSEHPDDPRGAACAAAFTRSLAVGGVDGTLRARFRADGLRGRVLGKTGTLSDSIALSGILVGADHRRLAFSLVTNGHDPSRKRAIRTGHEDVLAVLDAYLAATAGVERPAPAAPEAATAATTAPAEAGPAPDGEGEAGDDERDDPPAP